MDDLVAFITARLDEDEQRTRKLAEAARYAIATLGCEIPG